jgi:predicted PurR-regulated permease PerM
MSLKKYSIPIITLLATIAFVYLFTNVVIYLVISLVLALLGMPVVNIISKIKIGKFKISDTIAALLTLGLFFTVIYVIGITFLPPLISQVTFLSNSNLHDVMHNVFIYYPALKTTLLSFGTSSRL